MKKEYDFSNAKKLTVFLKEKILKNKIKKIENYNFNPMILKRVQKNNGYDNYHIKLIVEGMKDYFISVLLRNNNKELSNYPVTLPSLSVDYLWHEFIIFTKEYFDFCEDIFGEYVHHEPMGVIKEQEEKENTYNNILKFYDEYLKLNRNYNVEELNNYNKEIKDFYFLYVIDYVVNGTLDYETSYDESLKTINFQRN